MPFLEARDWLCPAKSEDRRHAWVWDHLNDRWKVCERADIYPGRTVLVAARWGGYDEARGFTGEKSGRRAGGISLPTPVEADAEACADAALNRDGLSVHPYKTIYSHSVEVAAKAREVISVLGLAGSLSDLFDLAARLHDWGKAHPVFQDAITDKGAHEDRQDLAKAPKNAWQRGYRRPGFRHELASTLAVLELLRRVDPWHPALLGPHRGLLVATGEAVPDAESSEGNAILGRLRALDADSFNLLLYLLCAHHGKVRGAWHAAPLDQDAADPVNGSIPLRGVRESDVIPAVALPAEDGALPVTLPAVTLHLDPAALGLSTRYGASWNERVLGLLEARGPFALAYLEALFRCADVRASQLDTADPLLPTP